jgi:hypothetical protein
LKNSKLNDSKILKEYIMDIYDRWLGIKRKHHLEKHTGESLQDAQGDLSCEICYEKNQDNQ